MKRLIERLIVLAFLVFPFVASAGEVIYVQSLKANLQSSPSFGSKVLAKVRKGQRLDVLEKNSGWYKVAHQGNSGWVSRFLVSANPPMERVSVFGAEDRALEQNARRRASIVTTTAAARGLAGEERARANRSSMANYSDLERIDALAIDDREALAFLEQVER